MRNEFLDSPEWQAIRSMRFAKDGFRCVDCGSIDNLQAHHLSNFDYDNPDIDQLVTVCEKCHKRRTNEIEKQRRIAIEKIGELQDGKIERMYLVSAYIQKQRDNGQEFIKVYFSRWTDGAYECSSAIYDARQIIKFLAVLSYKILDADYEMRIDMQRVLSAIRYRIGEQYIVRTRKNEVADKCYWNVRWNEVYQSERREVNEIDIRDNSSIFEGTPFD